MSVLLNFTEKILFGSSESSGAEKLVVASYGNDKKVDNLEQGKSTYAPSSSLINSNVGKSVGKILENNEKAMYINTGEQKQGTGLLGNLSGGFGLNLGNFSLGGSYSDGKLNVIGGNVNRGNNMFVVAIIVVMGILLFRK